MKRSTKTAPVSLSTSYLIGSPRIGISMITLQSLGTSLPAGTRSRLIVYSLGAARRPSEREQFALGAARRTHGKRRSAENAIIRVLFANLASACCCERHGRVRRHQAPARAQRRAIRG